MGKQTAFESAVASVGQQFLTVWQAPIPFILVVALVTLAIWQAMEWRYGGIIERLKDERDNLQKKLSSSQNSSEAATPVPDWKPSKELIDKNADQSAIRALKNVKWSADIAIAGRDRREIEAEVNEMRAAFLTAHKRFGTPLLPDLADVSQKVQAGRRIIEKMLPYLKAGHIDEAVREAQNFIDEIDRLNSEKD